MMVVHEFSCITIDFIIDHIYVTYIIDIIDFTFKGINMFWARLILAPSR